MIQYTAELLAMLDSPALLVRGGRIVHANAAARGLFGEDCAHRKLPQLLGEEIAGMQASSFVGETELRGRRFLLRMQAVDGMRIFLLTACSPAGEKIGDAFLHSLRSELMQLGVSAALLRSRLGEETPEIRDAARVVTQSLFRVNRVLGNLTVIRGVEDTTVLFRPQALDLCTLLRDLTDSVQAILPGQEIRLTLPHAAPMSGDAEMLESLVLNLMSNCIRHAGSSVSIRIGLLDIGEQYVLSVCDDGCGIPGDGMRTVMERYRFHSGPADAARGSGLGLTAARCIARLHGGTLLLESREGQGTAVRVSLRRELRSRQTLQAGVPEYEKNYDTVLTGLADCLPSAVYGAPFRES